MEVRQESVLFCPSAPSMPVRARSCSGFITLSRLGCRVEAEKEKLTEKLTEVESTLEEMDREYKERDEEV